MDRELERESKIEGRSSQHGIARRTMLLGGVSCGLVKPELVGGTSPVVPARLPSPWRPGTRLDNRISETRPYLDLFNPHNGEHWTGRFGMGGRNIADAKNHLDHFLRDWRKNVSVPMCYRLLWALARLTQELELQKPLFVLSGYRTPETNNQLEGAVPNSLHLQGRAVDIHSPEVGSRDLYKQAKSLQIGGTGWYPGKGFVHIDSGRLRNWQS